MATTANPHALDTAQDGDEQFELMQPPPSTFDPYKDRPISTNTYATRSHVHANGLWHCSVHIWIVNPSTSKILLQKRSMSKDTFPGRWDISSAGHVEANTSLIRTVQLELAEELGIDNVSEDELKLSFVIPAEQAELGGCNAYEHVYFLIRDNKDDSIDRFKLGTAEVSEVIWMPINDVLDALKTGDDGYAPRTYLYVHAMQSELDRILHK